MGIVKYMLRGTEIVETLDLLEWATWYDRPENTRVARTDVGPYVVSTIFLGINHRFHGEGPPILFETMVRGGPLDGDGQRACTYDEAIATHDRWVELLRAAVEPGVPVMPMIDDRW